ncbi:hypothetical protein K502DRAFT_368159 [Neoconidiobolus thromboides FSU 785]|nr:hypothetical protein K502DRAFT_368159 [Neoconidiobolus thromboides FSU 785]
MDFGIEVEADLRQHTKHPPVINDQVTVQPSDFELEPSLIDNSLLDRMTEDSIEASKVHHTYKLYTNYVGRLLTYHLKDIHKKPIYQINFDYDGAMIEEVSNQQLLGQIQSNFNQSYEVGLFINNCYNQIHIVKNHINEYKLSLKNQNYKEDTFIWLCLPRGKWKLTEESGKKETIAIFQPPVFKKN